MLGITKRSDKKKDGKAAVNILKARSRVLNIHITFMHVFVCVCVCVWVCVCVCVCVCACIDATLYYGCEKVLHNVCTTFARASESTFLCCHNVGSQRTDYKNITCIQCCHNMELFAGRSKMVVMSFFVVEISLCNSARAIYLMVSLESVAGKHHTVCTASTELLIMLILIESTVLLCDRSLEADVCVGGGGHRRHLLQHCDAFLKM